MSLKRTLFHLAADKRGLQKFSSKFNHSLDEVNKTINSMNPPGKKKR